MLESTEEDDVFINFVDHGAPGLVAFPSGELHADELHSALHNVIIFAQRARADVALR